MREEHECRAQIGHEQVVAPGAPGQPEPQPGESVVPKALVEREALVEHQVGEADGAAEPRAALRGGPSVERGEQREEGREQGRSEEQQRLEEAHGRVLERHPLPVPGPAGGGEHCRARERPERDERGEPEPRALRQRPPAPRG